MMGWIVLALLGAATTALLWLFAGRSALVLQMAGTAVLVAAAGYAWQGSPGLAGAAPQPVDVAATGPDAFTVQRELLGFASVGGDADSLAAADALTRQGMGDYAVATLRAAINGRPNNAPLWVGLAQALIRQANGLVTPAADFAFDRAAALDPKSPAPAYFRAMALAQSGQMDAAERIWRGQLAAAPARARWRPLLERNLLIVAAARQMGAGPNR